MAHPLGYIYQLKFSNMMIFFSSFSNFVSPLVSVMSFPPPHFPPYCGGGEGVAWMRKSQVSLHIRPRISSARRLMLP